MDAAVEWGLEGVEFPLPALNEGAIAWLKDALESRGLKFVCDCIMLTDAEPEYLRAYLQAAAALGARVVRSTLSGILCGERWRLPEGWDARLQEVADRLKDALPYAEALGLSIAMENHQDATTADLLRLAEMVEGHPAYGITLDAGNPLAVGEDPVEAATALSPWIRHIHMKDYTIHFAPEGYRLVRCAAGDGVVDFPAILSAVRSNGFPVLPGCEIAAQATRTIPWLEEKWWTSFPPRAATSLLGPLRILWEKGRPASEPYSSAWERGEDSAVVAAEERDIVQRSLDYFRGIM